jgi:glucosamine--fructose-6-phosphate aminotransferase (isomerizing)
MKEMILSHSEPFYFRKFRHGPKSIVNEDTLMIALFSKENAAHEQAVLKDMEKQGAQMLSLAQSNARISFASTLPEDYRNVLYLPAIQLLAFHRSMAKVLNPDKPNNPQGGGRIG